MPLRFLSTARSQFLTEIFESFFGISDPDLKGVGRLRIRRLMADLPNSYLNRTLISKFQPIWVLLLFVTIYSLLYLIFTGIKSNINSYHNTLMQHQIAQTISFEIDGTWVCGASIKDVRIYWEEGGP